MKTIRYGSFETNSSSTHAIVVPKHVDNDSYNLYDSLENNYCFGREECRLCEAWDEKLAYAYMLLNTNYEWTQSDNSWKPTHITTKEEIENFKNRVTKIWKEIEAQLNRNFSPTPQDVFDYIDRDGSDGDFDDNSVFVEIRKRWHNYIDHPNGLDNTNILDRLKNDDEFVKRFIFSEDSYITVGGDEYRGYNIKTIGFQYDYDECYYVNKKGEKPPKEWYDKNGRIKEKYWDKYDEEYNIAAGGFWNKLAEYQKDNDVFLKEN